MAYRQVGQHGRVDLETDETERGTYGSRIC